jgi:hypothetical protein
MMVPKMPPEKVCCEPFFCAPKAQTPHFVARVLDNKICSLARSPLGIFEPGAQLGTGSTSPLARPGSSLLVQLIHALPRGVLQVEFPGCSVSLPGPEITVCKTLGQKTETSGTTGEACSG